MMWKKIKEILCKHSAFKDESGTATISPNSLANTITGSLIDLKPSTITSSGRIEPLHHRTYRKATNKSTLNKTDEHCRSLFNLLPTSLRSRHQHQQTSNSRGIDASITTTTKTAARTSPTIDHFETDYDSGYMSQSVLNRTSSYVSCYSAVATTTPIPSMVRYGSIESLLHGHSKSNPARVRILVRKDFEPFAQAHLAVNQGMVVTALFSRGPWLYVRIEPNGLSGYIPRIICSLYKNRPIVNDKNYHHHHHHLSVSSTDSSSNKDDELDLTIVSRRNEKHLIHPYQKQQPPQINRYLSHSSAMINETQEFREQPKKRYVRMNQADRDRRNTCNLPPPLPPPPPPPMTTATTSAISTVAPMNSKKDRRVTLTTVHWPPNANRTEMAGIHQIADTSTTFATTTNGLLPTRDTDSSSTQDSGYSDSTPYFLVQQITPETEQTPTVTSDSKTTNPSPQYATVRRSSLLKAPDVMSAHHYSLRRQQGQSKGSTRTHQHRHTLLNGISMNDMMINDTNKRHSFGNFFANNQDVYDTIRSKMNPTSRVTTPKSSSSNRPVEFALIRDVQVRRKENNLYERIQPAIHNLPRSHRQIPASIFLNHHRQHHEQRQQFGSSHSAFRPVQPTIKGKRASSEGHSPSNEEHPVESLSVSNSSSSLSSSSSSSMSALSHTKSNHVNKQRRLSCDLPAVKTTKPCFNSLTRSVIEPVPTKNLTQVSRTMSEILCDQFSEINLDAIEKDSLQQPPIERQDHHNGHPPSYSTRDSFTILKDYRSSRASFSVKRGECVHVLKEAGRACYLVRKQVNGQIGFLPKALMIPTPKTRVETFLEMHGYQETVI